MNNRGVYWLAGGLILGLVALVVAGVEITSGIAIPSLGKAAYIWGGAGLVLLAIIAFFLWLIKKGGADTP
jgi:hypothetical protein